MKKFKWAFIGSGILANKVAAELLASERHEIVSVYSRTMAHAEKFAAKYSCKAFDNIKEAVEGADGVYVCSVNTAHFENVTECINLGKAVLCEKPMTINREESEKLFALAKEKGTYLAEAMWTWFNPVSIKVREWIKGGEIGEIKSAELYYALPTLKYYKAARLTDINQGGGALLDIGVYPITYAYNLFGMPEKVECKGALSDEYKVDLTEKVVMTYKNGLQCKISISLEKLDGLMRANFKGAKGKVKAPWFSNGKKAVLQKGLKKTVFEYENSYLTEFDAVSGEIERGLTESEYIPVQNTLDVMKILDDCRKQLGLVYPKEIN